jgi:hypothetical protein
MAAASASSAVTKEIKVSQWGSDWLMLNTNTCTAHLTDAKGEVGNTLGPTRHIKLENKSAATITFTSPYIDAPGNSVAVGPGQTYFSTIREPAQGIQVTVQFDKTMANKRFGAK